MDSMFIKVFKYTKEAAVTDKNKVIASHQERLVEQKRQKRLES